MLVSIRAKKTRPKLTLGRAVIIPFSKKRLPLLRVQIDHLMHIRINVRARRATRSRIAADEMEFAVDDIARQPVAGEFHRRQLRPAIVGRVIRFNRAEGTLKLAGALLQGNCIK